jgi:hypothetical protein
LLQQTEALLATEPDERECGHVRHCHQCAAYAQGDGLELGGIT